MAENTENYITFSTPIKKEIDNGKTVTYKINFSGSFRFISSSLSNLVDNLSEGFHDYIGVKIKNCILNVLIVENSTRKLLTKNKLKI